MKPSGIKWTSVPFEALGISHAVHDHDSGVRVITSDGALSVTYVPEIYRGPNAPHPIKGKRATDEQVAMVMKAFNSEHYEEDNKLVKGHTRIFFTPDN